MGNTRLLQYCSDLLLCLILHIYLTSYIVKFGNESHIAAK